MCKFKIQQKISSGTRKEIAALIAEVTKSEVTYLGAPTFAFKAGGYTVDKNSFIISPEIEIEKMKSISQVMECLDISGFAADGDLTISISDASFSENTIKNIENIIISKRSLLKKALNRNSEIEIPKLSVNSNEIEFRIFNATLKPEELFAYITLGYKISEMAKMLTKTKSKEREFPNPKYAFRCFLLRLGFVGSEFRVERKILLRFLEGNSAFREARISQKLEKTAV